MKGWVYVISNKSFQGMVKVGYTTIDPELRAKKLNHTGVPHLYLVDYEMLIEAPYEIERMTHSILSSKREGREWFRCSAEKAIAAIKLAAGTGAISEIYKRAERAKAEALHRQELEARELRRRQENEEAIIRQKYDAQIAASFSSGPFWVYWLGGGILVLIPLAIFFPKMYSGIFMLSALLGAPAGLWLQHLFESKHSRSFRALEKQRDEALEAVRGKTPAQPANQEGTPFQEQLAELQKQADSGDELAQFKLGSVYLEKSDASKALYWYQKAAAQGDARIQHFLGKLYSQGKWVPKDDAKALEWCRNAAVQGHVEAQNELGLLYFRGHGVPADSATARQWWEKAAAQGNAEAQQLLGVLYSMGDGVPRDCVRAYMWHYLAAANGKKSSAELRDELAEKMTPAQIAEAQQLARKWTPKTPSPTDKMSLPRSIGESSNPFLTPCPTEE